MIIEKAIKFVGKQAEVAKHDYMLHWLAEGFFSVPDLIVDNFEKPVNIAYKQDHLVDTLDLPRKPGKVTAKPHLEMFNLRKSFFEHFLLKIG